VCQRCKSRGCESGKTTQTISVCEYGLNFRRVDSDLVIAGVIIKEEPISSTSNKKVRKRYYEQIIPKSHLISAIETLIRQDVDEEHEIAEAKESIIREYVNKEQYKKEFLDPLREEILKGLSFVHDYKQINSQISQNINVIIETSYNGADFAEKLTNATFQEKAIYHASKFLEEKLNVARLLINPAWLERREECKPFKFHGQVIKYVRIYDSLVQRKNLTVKVTGTSRLEVLANPTAVSVIPHTFIDNAVKYSPQNEPIEIYVQDYGDKIIFSVSSYGPQITNKEKELIFQAFYRGKAAKEQEEEGAGYGLYICQQVATEHLGATIEVTQDGLNKKGKYFWTQFSVNVPLRAKIL
jgi:signal transduction histidine kinase